MSNTTELLCPLLQEMRAQNISNSGAAWTVVCIHGLLSCIGILENALILWVVGFRLRQRTVASVWVLNLAMSDFLATLTLPLFTSYLYHSHSWELGYLLCKVEASIFFLNMFVSAYLLAAISLDRLILVVKPVWSQNHRSVAGAWKVCVLGWILAAINTLPYTLFRSVIKKQDRGYLCYHNFALILSSRATLERDCNVRQSATAISKLLLAFLFPLLVIAGSYIKIGITLRNKTKRRKQNTIRLTDTLIVPNKGRASETTNTPTTAKSNNTFPKLLASSSSSTPTPTTLAPTTSVQTYQSQLSQSFIKMVTFVIAAFAVCWAPYHIFCMIEIKGQHKLRSVEVGLPLATTIAFLNPVLNPILYAFSCPQFCVRIRQSLAAVFEALVEEEGLMGPGRNIKAHIRQKRSQDVTPSIPEDSLSPFKSDIQPPLPPHLAAEGLEDSHMENTGQQSKNEVEPC